LEIPYQHRDRQSGEAQDVMIRAPKSFASLLNRGSEPPAEKLYGAIVAHTRLPVFYQEVGAPDTLQGRFAVLSVHLFAVLHRLKAHGPGALPIAQELIDRFSADMETVMREIGIGDLAVPKKARGLAAASAALLQDYEQAYAEGQVALVACLAKILPPGVETEAASGRLATYLRDMVRQLEAQSFGEFEAGVVKFPEVRASDAQFGDRPHE
jgi:cytochrome b pre-mRNA-processing protein 3